MNAFRLFGNEVSLLRRSIFAGAVPVLTLGFVILGMQAVDNANDLQFHGMGRTAFTMGLGAAQYGALAGAALFAMLTLLNLSRDRRQRSRALIEAAAGQGGIVAARIGALLALGLLTALGALMLTAVAHPVMTSTPYEPMPYVFSVGLVLLPAVWSSILIAAALELACQDLDMAFLTFAAVYVLGLGASNYMLRWVQTTATVYSDFAGIEPVGRLVICSRLFWACATAGVFLTGWWLRRHPGFSLGASLARNSARGALPLAAAGAVTVAVWMYARQPHVFTADSALQRQLPRAQDVWLEAVECHAQLEPAEKKLAATVRYGFTKQADAAPVEFITNAGLDIEAVQVNGADAGWRRLPGTDRVVVDLPTGDRSEVTFRYQGHIRYPVPSGFPGYITDRSVYLLENSHWLFEPLVVSRQAIRVSGSVTAPSRLTVVTPGRLESVTDEKRARTWHFAATCPELTLGLFAAEYEREVFESGTTKVEFYYSPRHAAYIRASGIAGHMRDILSFYQTLMGPYPFEGMPLKVVETSVYKPGGHASLNVVTLAEYLLHRAKVPDPDKEPRFILRDLKILAHELAHQWWGGGVATADAGGWSSEGLAEYVAYKYLASRYPPGVTDNLSRGWRSRAAGRRSAYYLKDPRALDRMRPALREKLLRDRGRSRAYSAMPTRLLAAEARVGEAEVRRRLASVFRQSRGRVLTWAEFSAGMGADALGDETAEP